jgi:hypothetical protein
MKVTRSNNNPARKSTAAARVTSNNNARSTSLPLAGRRAPKAFPARQQREATLEAAYKFMKRNNPLF